MYFLWTKSLTWLINAALTLHQLIIMYTALLSNHLICSGGATNFIGSHVHLIVLDSSILSVKMINSIWLASSMFSKCGKWGKDLVSTTFAYDSAQEIRSLDFLSCYIIQPLHLALHIPPPPNPHTRDPLSADGSIPERFSHLRATELDLITAVGLTPSSVATDISVIFVSVWSLADWCFEGQSL